jgi:hypothetical protein
MYILDLKHYKFWCDYETKTWNELNNDIFLKMYIYNRIHYEII